MSPSPMLEPIIIVWTLYAMNELRPKGLWLNSTWHVVVFNPYADDQRIVVRVVKASCIRLRESDYGAFPLCYLRHRARQLNILDYPKVSLPSFFGWPSDCRSSHDYSYVPYGGLGRSLSRRGFCSWGGWSVLSFLTNLCNFPCLIRASICCFKL